MFLQAYFTLIIFISPIKAQGSNSNLFIGGWALRSSTPCGQDYTDCEVRGVGKDYYACCPLGQYCRDASTLGPDKTACCSDLENCYPQAEQFNVCANDTWVEFNNMGAPFCCLLGQMGYIGSVPSGQISKCGDGDRELLRSEEELPPVDQGSRGPTATGTTRTGTLSITSLVVSSSDSLNIPDGRDDTVTSLFTAESKTSFSGSQTEDSKGQTGSTSTIGSAGTTDTSNSGSGKPGSLSTGAIIGIVLGCLLGIIVAGVGGWLIGRKCMKREFGKEALNNQIGGIQASSS